MAPKLIGGGGKACDSACSPYPENNMLGLPCFPTQIATSTLPEVHESAQSHNGGGREDGTNCTSLRITDGMRAERNSEGLMKKWQM